MINQITTTNMMGLGGTTTFAPKAASLIAGPNGHGKTSLVESIRLALLGGTGRVDLKKDLAQLVTDGQKKASATVATASGAYSIALPDGRGTHIEDATGLLSILLEPQRLAQLKDGERRQLVLAAGGVRLGVEAVRAALAERGRDSDKAEAVLPLLRQGFDEAAKEASRRATEAKGAWRAVTGETYGDKKADCWGAECPAYEQDLLEAAEAAITAMEADKAQAQQRLGQLLAQLTAITNAERRTAELQELAALEKRRATKLARDEKDLSEWQASLSALEAMCGTEGHAKEPLACPCCGGALALEGGALVEFVPATATADDHKELAKAREVVASLERTITNSKRDLAESQGAAAEIAAIAAAADGLSAADIKRQIAAVESEIAELSHNIAAENTVIIEENNKRIAAAAAKHKTSAAAAHHADVLAWSAIAEDLQPSGIRAQMTSKALLPLQQLLAKFSETLGWRAIELNSDMTITASGRPYRLLSESEQWRVDLVLAMALAKLSGLGLVLADRFDVLDVNNRAGVLDLVDAATADGLQIIMAGTLRAAPDLGDDWAVLWLGDRAGAAGVAA